LVNNCTQDETAAATGVPVTTIETRLHRAKKMLRELLKDGYA
jgi:DNA-directed RNA polymerase specialized sigma24 family protein